MTKNLTDFKQKYVCLDNSESKSYSLGNEGGDIMFKGWDIKDKEQCILQELKEYFEEQEVSNLKILSEKKMAYSVSRYYDGSDAQDEGYSFWINYEDNWQKGLGKCTSYHIEFKLSEVLHHD